MTVSTVPNGSMLGCCLALGPELPSACMSTLGDVAVVYDDASSAALLRVLNHRTDDSSTWFSVTLEARTEPGRRQRCRSKEEVLGRPIAVGDEERSGVLDRIVKI